MDMINAMFGDTLWIYTAIAGALIGAALDRLATVVKALNSGVGA